MNFQIKPIGYIESPFKKLSDIPKQSIYGKDKRAVINILDEYLLGIRDIKEGTYIILLFYFNKSKGYKLLQVPRDSNDFKGVFSTRSPFRPNSIGMSIVKVISIKNKNLIEIEGVDMLNKTPVIDIKPYIPELNPKDEEL